MDHKLIKKAKEIIDKIIYITLATSDKEGNPWNSPVFAAFDNHYTFYWRSGKNPDDFSHDYPRRIYKAIPERFWINVDGEIDGNYLKSKKGSYLFFLCL